MPTYRVTIRDCLMTARGAFEQTKVKTLDAVSRIESHLPGSDHFIRIADGTYSAAVVAVLGGYFDGHPKVKIWLRIVDDIPGDERMIELFANVERLIKNESIRNPTFQVGQRHKLTRMARTLWPGRFVGNKRPAQWPLCDEPVLIQTTTVVKDSNGHDLPVDSHYSKADKIIGWAEQPSSPSPNLTLPNPPSPSLTFPTPPRFDDERAERQKSEFEYLDSEA